MDYRWNIYLVNLDPVMGSVQGKTRPVLVISDDDINAILPLINKVFEFSVGLIRLSGKNNQCTLFK